MEYRDIIRAVLKETGTSQTALAEKLGVSNRSVISTQLRRRDMYVSSFVRILEELGYEVIVQPRGKEPGAKQMRLSAEKGE